MRANKPQPETLYCKSSRFTRKYSDCSISAKRFTIVHNEKMKSPVTMSMNRGAPTSSRSQAGATAHLVFLLTTVLLIVSNNCCSVSAAHAAPTRSAGSSSREPHYDRSITTFNSEGRLLQVEYGMEAALRGSTVAALSCIPGSDDGDDEDAVYLVIQSKASSAITSSSSLKKVYRIDEHVVLVAAGLVGDARFLVTQLRQYCQSARKNYGEAPTVRDVATMAAEWQHTLTRMEGARPLAASCLIVGVDPTTATTSRQQQQPPNKRTRIFRTGPGGSMEEYRYCAIGQGQNHVMKALSVAMELVEQTKKKQSSKPKDTAKPQSLLLKATLQSLDLKNDETVDVWRIRPKKNDGKNQQGGGYYNSMDATCFQGVTLANLDQVASQ